MSHDAKGFWCEHCHYGGTGIREFTKCPQCGSETILTQTPFTPGKPSGIGSGKPNGKTARKRAGIKGGPEVTRATNPVEAGT